MEERCLGFLFQVERRCVGGEVALWVVLDFREWKLDQETTLRFAQEWSSRGALAGTSGAGLIQLRVVRSRWLAEVAEVYGRTRWNRMDVAELWRLSRFAPNRDKSFWTKLCSFVRLRASQLPDDERLFVLTLRTLERSGAYAAQSVAAFRGSREQLQWCLRELDGFARKTNVPWNNKTLT